MASTHRYLKGIFPLKSIAMLLSYLISVRYKSKFTLMFTKTYGIYKNRLKMYNFITCEYFIEKLIFAKMIKKLPML
jgi:hypothetical protein